MELLDDVHRLAQPAAIDLVSDDSGAENDLLASDTNQLRGVQNQAAAPEEDGTDFGNLDGVQGGEPDPISPALSYLTIDDSKDDEARVVPEDFPSAQENTGNSASFPHSRQLSFASDDAESSEEEDGYVGQIPPAMNPEEDTKLTRLLYAKISNVEQHIRDASDIERGHFQLLSQSVPGRPTGKSLNNYYSSGSDSSLHEKRSALRRNPNPVSTRPINRHKPASSDNRRTRQTSNALNGKPLSVVVPKAAYARARRVIVPNEFPICTIYMRGDAQFIDQETR